MRIIISIVLMLFILPSYGGGLLPIDSPIEQASNKRILHTVQKGESLSSILKSYNLSLDKFLKANRALNGTNLSLSLGQEIVIIKKDMGSASDLEITHQIKEYLLSIGSSRTEEQNHTVVAATEVQKSVLKRELSKVEKYNNDDDRGQPIKLLPWSDEISMTMLLPLTNNDGGANSDYESFYKGAVLAMNQLKSDGISLNVDVYDTGHSTETVQQLIQYGALKGRNLVIGPIYKDQFNIVSNYLKNRGSILVSPLSVVDCNASNVFQLAPSASKRYDKFKELFNGANIVYFKSKNDDTAFNDAIQKLIPTTTIAKGLIVTNETSDSHIASYLSQSKQNVIIVSAKEKADVELLMSKIATLKKGAFSSHRISVVGSPEFSKISDSKKDDFFRSNTYFTTSYHQDRLNETSLEFETQYVEMFGELPTLFSYRAYDAVILFASMMYESGKDFYEYSQDQLMNILQVNYRFMPENGKNVNQEWMLVNYRPDYTIIVK